MAEKYAAEMLKWYLLVSKSEAVMSMETQRDLLWINLKKMIEIGRKIHEFLQSTFPGVILIKHANVKSTWASLLCCYDVIARHDVTRIS